MKRIFYTVILLLTIGTLIGQNTDNSKTTASVTLNVVNDIDKKLKDAVVFVNGSGNIEVQISDDRSDINTTLYTITGRKLDTKKISAGSAIFDREMLYVRGIYIVNLESGQAMHSRKIIVE